jgi:hypothetical protein
MLLFRRAVLGYICGVSGSDDGAGADASCGVGGVSAVLLTSLGCWATVRPGELASDRGKLVFDKLRPQQLRYTIAVGCFWLGDGDPSILRSFRLSCWFEPYPHVINSIMQEQEAAPNCRPLLGWTGFGRRGLRLKDFGG